MKFSEIGVTQGWPDPTFTSAKKLEYFNTLMAWVLDDDDGVTKIDYRMKRVYEVMFGLQIFREIEFDTILDADGEPHLDGILKTYDEICKVKDIEQTVLYHEQLMDVLDQVDCALLQEVEVGNSFGVIVGKELKKLVDKIPSLDIKQLEKLTKNLGKEVAKLNPETLELLKKVGK